jgi:Lrp/AsnC ligand binding domain
MRRAQGSEIPGSATNGEESEPMTAYVLVQTATQDGRIANLLRRLPEIVFAEDVRGPYDALALVRSDAGFEAIVDRVRGLPGVTHALAAPLVHESVGLVSNTAA